MDLKEIESAMEGILFAAGEPVGVERICLALEIDRATADAVAQKLMDAYSYERRGIRLIKLDSSYQLCSAPEYAELIRKTFESRRPAYSSGGAVCYRLLSAHDASLRGPDPRRGQLVYRELAAGPRAH